MSYTDWIPTMDSITNKKNLSVFEFGLGYGTEYLLDNFKQVYSFELAQNNDWYGMVKQMFGNRENWKIEFLDFNEVDFIYTLMSELPNPLIEKINSIFQDKYDVVFIDGGYLTRGLIANLVLNNFRPNFMVVHDILAMEVYGYEKIICPEGYDFTDDNNGEGTRIYFKK